MVRDIKNSGVKDMIIIGMGEKGVQIIRHNSETGEINSSFSSQSIKWWLKNEVEDYLNDGWIVRLIAPKVRGV